MGFGPIFMPSRIRGSDIWPGLKRDCPPSPLTWYLTRILISCWTRAGLLPSFIYMSFTYFDYAYRCVLFIFRERPLNTITITFPHCIPYTKPSNLLILELQFRECAKQLQRALASFLCQDCSNNTEMSIWITEERELSSNFPLTFGLSSTTSL